MTKTSYNYAFRYWHKYPSLLQVHVTENYVIWHWPEGCYVVTKPGESHPHSMPEGSRAVEIKWPGCEPDKVNISLGVALATGLLIVEP